MVMMFGEEIAYVKLNNNLTCRRFIIIGVE